MIKPVLLIFIIALCSVSSLRAEPARWIDASHFPLGRTNPLPVTSLSFSERFVAPGQYYAALLGLDASSELREIRRSDGLAGHRNFRFQQFHRGLEVFNAQLIVREYSSGKVQAMMGRYAKGIDSDIDWTHPLLTNEEAIERSVDQYRMTHGRELSSSDFRSELVIAHLNRKIHLVYFTLGAGGAVTSFVDARSGDVLDSWDSIPRSPPLR